MKTTVMAALAVAALLVCPLAQAELSCEEVEEVGEALAAVGITMESGVEIGEVEDGALREIVDGLHMIAAAEQNSELDAAADALESAWQAEDRDGFVDGIAHAMAVMAVVSVTECE
jgi:propanediol dehydratase small subunit